MHYYSPRFLGALGVAAGLLSGCSPNTPKPVTPPRTPITVSVSEGGAPAYTLRDAYVESATYDTKISSLSISGKLASGKTIGLTFGRLPSSTLPAYTTDQFTATLDGVAATQASGTSTYSAQVKTADGNFTATFPTTGVITGRFISVPTQ